MSDELVLNNINLIYHALKKLELFDQKELYEEVAMIGLVRASQKYNPSLGYKFSTFAMKYIKNEILKYIQIQNYQKRKCTSTIISLDDFVLNEQRLYHEVIGDKFNLEEDFFKKQQIKLLHQILNILDSKDSFIIKSYFGLKGNKKMTQREIAKILKISPEMVRHKMNKSFKIIKKIMEDKYGKENE